MSTQQQAQHIARVFHETYEFLAPDFGYETRDDSAVPWEQVPPANRALMVATVQALLDAGVIKSRAETIQEVVREARKHDEMELSLHDFISSLEASS